MAYICSLKVDARKALAGDIILTSMEDLYRAIVEKECRDIIIEKDFAQSHFTPSGLTEFIESINIFNPLIRIEVLKDYSKSFNSGVETFSKLRNIEEVIKFILMNKDESFKIITELCNNYKKSYTESLNANNKLSTMHLEVSEAKNKVEAELSKNKYMSEILSLNKVKLDTLVSRININYDKSIDEKAITGFRVDSFNYSKVLYIKEITRVHYVDTLIYYLQEILKTIYEVPAKLVVIEPAYSYGREYLYPRCKPHINLTYRDIGYSDIIMSGFQQTMMKDILLNTSRVPYLIILDRSGYKEPYVKGSKVETYYTISDLKDLNFDIEADRVISYESDTEYIPYIEDFDDLQLEEKIQKYSSMTIMKNIINVLEG